MLPERTFTKPLAKAVVEQRKKLVRDPTSPEGVANALDALTLGGDKVIDDSTVYLALRNALLAAADRHVARQRRRAWSSSCGRRRCASRKAICPRPSARSNAAQDALMQALKEGAAPEEIKRLVDELRSALSRYLQALASQAARQRQHVAAGAAERRSARVAAGPR